MLRQFGTSLAHRRSDAFPRFDLSHGSNLSSAESNQEGCSSHISLIFWQCTLPHPLRLQHLHGTDRTPNLHVFVNAIIHLSIANKTTLCLSSMLSSRLSICTPSSNLRPNEHGRRLPTRRSLTRRPPSRTKYLDHTTHPPATRSAHQPCAATSSSIAQIVHPVLQRSQAKESAYPAREAIAAL
jgi:hypothetical protein